MYDRILKPCQIILLLPLCFLCVKENMDSEYIFIRITLDSPCKSHMYIVHFEQSLETITLNTHTFVLRYFLMIHMQVRISHPILVLC